MKTYGALIIATASIVTLAVGTEIAFGISLLPSMPDPGELARADALTVPGGPAAVLRAAPGPQIQLAQDQPAAPATPPSASPLTPPAAPPAAPVEVRKYSATGSFHDGQPGHHGTGKATIASPADGGKPVLTLTGFRATPGPDLEVLLVPKDDVRTERDVTTSKYIEVAALKSPSGDQTYALPSSIDPAQYKSVVIWCRSYGVLFAAAPLKSSN